MFDNLTDESLINRMYNDYIVVRDSFPHAIKSFTVWRIWANRAY